MAKAAKPQNLLNPALLTMAGMAGWAAAHEPATFTPASGGVWVCGAVTTALLTRAMLALFMPIFALFGGMFNRALATAQRESAEP